MVDDPLIDMQSTTNLDAAAAFRQLMLSRKTFCFVFLVFPYKLCKNTHGLCIFEKTILLCNVTTKPCFAYVAMVQRYTCHKTTHYRTILSRLVLVIKHSQSSTPIIISSLVLGIEYSKSSTQ